MRAAAAALDAEDVIVFLFETDGAAGEELPRYAEGVPRLTEEDFGSSDGLTEDSSRSGHGYARRLFTVSGRHFALFAESGARPPSSGALRGLNELLASLRVEPGDPYPGTVEPARFAPRPGWHLGTSGPDERRASHEWTTSWASTIPYEDEWNALPPFKTLLRLPEAGIVVWVSLSRTNRVPPHPDGNETFPPREPPFLLEEFERRDSWEGQVRQVPEYVLLGTVRGQYQLELRVYVGRPDPTRAMLAEAQAMLDGLVLPDWGDWESG
jgi:hypothetical protein